MPQSGKISGDENCSRSLNFVDGQGNLERTWEVREKSGILKINGYGRQSSEPFLNAMFTSHYEGEWVFPPYLQRGTVFRIFCCFPGGQSPLLRGSIHVEKNAPREQILPFKHCSPLRREEGGKTKKKKKRVGSLECMPIHLNP